MVASDGQGKGEAANAQEGSKEKVNEIKRFKSNIMDNELKGICQVNNCFFKYLSSIIVSRLVI